MALTKRIEHDCSVLPDGQIQAREITIIEEDGVEISRKYHRWVVDLDETDESKKPGIIGEIAAKVHTPERVAARAQAKANANSPVAG